MNWFSKIYNVSCQNREVRNRRNAGAFSLVEVVTALIILDLVFVSVLAVINRCVISTTNSALQMQAFEVARENMETLLSEDSVQETVEYGTSDKYPAIQWQTVVETFYEPISASMWLRGICSAEYTDASGQNQKVELTHWLTGLTQEQLAQIMNQQDEESFKAQLLETVEDAAEYAGVESDVIEQWINDGMLTTDDGLFIKSNLDLYKRTGGNPSPEEKSQQISSAADLAKQNPAQGQQNIDPKTGLPYDELEKKDVSEIWDLLKSRQR